MLTRDYNGWNDAPEAEREWFDQHPEIWAGARPEQRTSRREQGCALPSSTRAASPGPKQRYEPSEA